MIEIMLTNTSSSWGWGVPQATPMWVSRVAQTLARHLSQRNWSQCCCWMGLQRQLSTTLLPCSSRRRTHPALLDLGCLQHGQFYYPPDGMGGILKDLSCHYQSGLVKRLLPRWHKQGLFRNPFPALFLVIGGKDFVCFLISTWGYFRCCEQSTVLD